MLPTVIVPGYLESDRLPSTGTILTADGLPNGGATAPPGLVTHVRGRPVTPILQQLDRTVKQVLQQYNAL